MLSNEGADARGMALGRAYTAVVADNTALYWNPGGLGNVLQAQASAMHVGLFDGASYDYMGYARPYKGRGAWGAQLMRLGGGSGAKRDALNNEKGTFGYSETGFGMGYGHRGLLSPRVSLGGGVKVLQRTLGSSADKLMGVDFGMQYRTGPKTRWGMVFQNIGSISSGDTDDRLPFKIRAGMSRQLFSGFMVAAELRDFKELNIGTEYDLGLLAVRAGFVQNKLTAGGGIRIRGLSLDYAMQSHPQLGMSQRFSVGYRFGGRVEDTRKRRVEELLSEATQLRQEGRWGEALAKLNQAEAISEWEGRVIEQRRRLAAVQRQMPGDFGRWDLSETYRKGLNAYVDGEFPKAVLLLNCALGDTEKKNERLDNFVRKLGREKNLPVLMEERKPVKELIALKLIRAEEALVEEDYKKALQFCQEAVMLEEENATSHTRLGSVYFMMGLRDKALAAWERALEIDPGYEELKRYIKKLGSKASAR
jgi:hypothetical protein